MFSAEIQYKKKRARNKIQKETKKNTHLKRPDDVKNETDTHNE